MELAMHGNILVFWKIGTKVCKDFAVCFECKQECKYSGSTSNLNEHLKRHHTETMPLPGKKSIQSQITTMMKQCKMFRLGLGIRTKIMFECLRLILGKYSNIRPNTERHRKDIKTFYIVSSL